MRHDASMVSTRRTVTLHGHPMAWHEAGPEDAEEVVVLLHGVAGSSVDLGHP